MSIFNKYISRFMWIFDRRTPKKMRRSLKAKIDRDINSTFDFDCEYEPDFIRRRNRLL